jgi:hypothetical protein
MTRRVSATMARMQEIEAFASPAGLRSIAGCEAFLILDTIF